MRAYALASAAWLGLAGVAGDAGAAQWSLEPSAEAGLSYNDNLALTPGTRDSVVGYQVAPRAVFAWRDALSEVAGEGRIGLNRYPGKRDLDTTDLLGELRAATRSERNVFSGAARVLRDSTLDTEQRQTGVVQTRRQRTQKTLSPGYRRILTERTSASLNYQLTDVGYERGAGLRDYRNHQWSLGHAWDISERVRTDTSVSWNSLRTDDDTLRTRTSSLNQALTYAWAEKASLGVSAGWRSTRTTLNRLQCPLGAELRCILGLQPLVPLAVTTKERGLILGVDANGELTRGRYGLSFSRGTSPTADGLVVRTDRLEARWSFDWNERMTYGVSGAWLRSVYDGDLGAGSRYLAFDGSLDWRLDERWTAGLRYTFVRSRTDGGVGSATSNALYATMSYHWQPLSLK